MSMTLLQLALPVLLTTEEAPSNISIPTSLYWYLRHLIAPSTLPPKHVAGEIITTNSLPTLPYTDTQKTIVSVR